MRPAAVAGSILFAILCIACGGGGSKPSIPEPDLEDEVILQSTGERVAVSADTDTMREINEAVKAGNRGLVARKIAAGKAFTVPTGTRAKIVDFTMTAAKVKILEGEHSTETGYVYRGSYKAAGPNPALR